MEDPFSVFALGRGVWFPGQGDGWCMVETCVGARTCGTRTSVDTRDVGRTHT